VHRLQGPEGALVAEIESRFPGTTGPEGVNRGALAERVLGEREALQNLEALIHPAVARERTAFLAEHASAPLVVLDIPLLFETGGANASTRLRSYRLPPACSGRECLAGPDDGEKFERILALQMPDEEKRARATFVIPTGGDLSTTRSAVREIIACLANPADS
jgi:dephospho-CoA kinase